MSVHRKEKLYCGYDNNTNESQSGQNVWASFRYPSSAINIYRNSGAFSISNDNGALKFTLLKESSSWYSIMAVCNIYKGSGANQSRNVELCWYLNGVQAGPIRGSHMNNNECNIVSGDGQIYLSQGDVIQPYIRVIDNNDKVLLKNCSFNIVEDIDNGTI